MLERHMSDKKRIVYSSDNGRIKAFEAPPTRSPVDGIIYLQRQVSGRKGKGVCLISGLNWDSTELLALASALKKKCASGGTVKEGVIEIQGNNRDLLKQLLEARGLKVKLVGG